MKTDCFIYIFEYEYGIYEHAVYASTVPQSFSHSQPIKLNGNGYTSECSNNECECYFFVNFMHDAF